MKTCACTKEMEIATEWSAGLGPALGVPTRKSRLQFGASPNMRLGGNINDTHGAGFEQRTNKE